jgi:pyrimidine-nucleoside phosphorylase
MDRPLGYAIGNSLEVIDAVETLQGKGPEDLTELCVTLASHILNLAKKGDFSTCEKLVREAIANGTALEKLVEMVWAQGGDATYILNTDKFEKAKFTKEVKAKESGYIVGVDTENYGVASLLLGAGRNTKEDIIDMTAGIQLCKKTGDFVNAGDVIAVLYSGKDSGFAAAEERLLSATKIEAQPPKSQPLVLEIVE